MKFRVALLLLLAGCGQTDGELPRPHPSNTAAAGDFAVVPCLHISGEIEYAAECGTLVVPENRYDEGSRLISIPVKRIRASADAPAEPIFYLTGGPGMSNLDYDRVHWFHDTHDIVLVGYRGVDGTAYLSCPEVSEALTSGPAMLSRDGMAAQSLAYSTCATRLTEEGIDLDGYTVLEVVDDIEAARQALGYTRINLESGSYGTRLAQIYVQRHPDHVHRNAMVAVNPPGRFWWDGAIVEQQIFRYAALCAEDEYCASRTDDLVASMQTALDNMPERWLVFPLNRGAVLFSTFTALYATDAAASVFDLWLAAADGDYSGMALISAMFPLMISSDMAWADFAAKGTSVEYDYDPTADYAAEITPGPYLLGSPASLIGWTAAAVWPANKIPDEYRTVQTTSIETLMLSGSLDLSTPAQNARDQLLPQLQNGQQVVLSEFSHTADLLHLQPDATQHLLATFFASGEVDDSLFQPNTVNFEPQWGFPLVAKLVLGGAGLILLIAFLVLRYLVGRFRQSLIRRAISPGPSCK